MGVCSLQLFYTKHRLVLNRDSSWHQFFTSNFSIFGPHNIKMPEKIRRSQQFQYSQPYWLLMFKKMNFGWNIGILKRIVFKNAKYFITSSSFPQFRNSKYQQNQKIISYTFGQILCLWQSNQCPKIFLLAPILCWQIYSSCFQLLDNYHLLASWSLNNEFLFNNI